MIFNQQQQNKKLIAHFSEAELSHDPLDHPVAVGGGSFLGVAAIGGSDLQLEQYQCIVGKQWQLESGRSTRCQ
jgi:hypothetical protein